MKNHLNSVTVLTTVPALTAASTTVPAVNPIRNRCRCLIGPCCWIDLCRPTVPDSLMTRTSSNRRQDARTDQAMTMSE